MNRTRSRQGIKIKIKVSRTLNTGANLDADVAGITEPEKEVRQSDYPMDCS
jgi:hypothetical protein